MVRGRKEGKEKKICWKAFQLNTFSNSRFLWRKVRKLSIFFLPPRLWLGRIFFYCFSFLLGWLIETYGETKKERWRGKKTMERKEGGGLGGPLIESVSAGDRQRLHPLLVRGPRCLLFSMGKCNTFAQVSLVRVGNTPSSADSWHNRLVFRCKSHHSWSIFNKPSWIGYSFNWCLVSSCTLSSRDVN